MLRSTRIAAKHQLKGGLTYASKDGHLRHSGFQTPYQTWQWKQGELFRAVFEDQTTHLRKVYAKQYYEAYISNAEEYVSKYSVTKAATLAGWEADMEAQEATRRSEYERVQGRTMLRRKHLDMIREKRERQFFHWYERASERLQYMDETFKWVTRENLDAHLEKELSKYQAGETPEETRAKHFPLNFIGQMPYLEDADMNIVSAPNRRAAGQFNTSGAPAGRDPIDIFEPTHLDPRSSAASAASGEAAISGAVRGLDDDESAPFDDVVARVVDDMADDTTGAPEIDTIDPVAEMPDVERRGSLRATIERAQHGLKEVDFADRREDATTTGRSPTLAESKKDAATNRRRQVASARKRMRDKRGGSAAQTRQEKLQDKNRELFGADGEAKKGGAAAAPSAVDESDPNYVSPQEREKIAARKRRDELRAISQDKLEQSRAFGLDKGHRAVTEAMKGRDDSAARKSDERKGKARGSDGSRPPQQDE